MRTAPSHSLYLYIYFFRVDIKLPRLGSGSCLSIGPVLKEYFHALSIDSTCKASMMAVPVPVSCLHILDQLGIWCLSPSPFVVIGISALHSIIWVIDFWGWRFRSAVPYRSGEVDTKRVTYEDNMSLCRHGAALHFVSLSLIIWPAPFLLFALCD